MSRLAVARDATTSSFFDGTARGEFLLRRCSAGHWSRPQARQCSVCGSTELSWEPASGAARLVSWAVLPREPAVVVAIGELAEGPWWWSELVGASGVALAGGDLAGVDLAGGEELRIAFDRAEEGEAVPVFELVR